MWFAGGRELMAVRLRHGLSPYGRARAASFAWQETEAPPAPGDPHSEEGDLARRPGTWEPSAPRGGFTEDEIRRLERFRGSLRRFPREP